MSSYQRSWSHLGLVLATAMLLGGAATVAWCAGQETTEAAPPPTATHSFRGTVSPSRKVVLSAPLEGVVQKILAKESERVEAGQVLAQMDDGVQKVAVELARMEAESDAQVRRARLALADAEIQVERINQTFAQKAASDWEVRRARLGRDQAAAEVDAYQDAHEAAKARCRLEEARLARYRIVAPFAGRVVRVVTEEGTTLTPSDAILSLAALDTLEAVVAIPTEHYPGMRQRIGTAFKFTAEEPEIMELTGVLKTVDPVADTASRTVRCVFVIDNVGERLPAGFVVRLDWPQ